jgi:Zn-dependent protease with chaperone function
MTVLFKHGRPGELRRGVLPPWLWFWLAIYILGFPAVFDRIKIDLLIIFTGNDGINPPLGLLERIPAVVELLFDLTLSVGVLMVFLPWIRTKFLQRKYGLTEPQFLSPEEEPRETLQTLSAMSQFVREYAPGIILTYNASGKLLRDKAFVYPIGYRRTGMAVAGALLALWDRDQQAARAVLLHEIEHYRHGDEFVIGAGSLLETIIKHWFLLAVIFGIVPFIPSILITHITESQQEMAMVADLPRILSFHIQQFLVVDIPFSLLLFFQSFFWVASLFTIVIAAIWCAEINADRFVIDTMQSVQTLANTMEQHATSPSWWGWLWSGSYHPPAKVRRWLVQRSEGMSGLALLLLVFPAAWFVRLVFVCGWALSRYLLFLYGGTSAGYIVGELGIGIVYFLEALVPVWIAIAVLIALWPILVRYWERFFGHTAGRPANASYGAYLSSTGFVVFVCIIGLVLSLLPAPAEPAGFKPTVPHSTANTPNGHFKVGDTVAIGNLWMITVHGAQVKLGNAFFPTRPDHDFLAVDVSLKNISSQTNSIANGRQFVLKDLHGVSYDETYVAAIPPPAASQNGKVPAGVTVRGQLTYEVPVSVSQFTLSFKADRKNYDPSQWTVWDITTSPNASSTATGVPTPTVRPTPPFGTSTSGYPTLQKLYHGTLVNTTDNNNTSADATLSSIVQDQQGGISGNMTIQPPLVGSGPFTGTVISNGTIQFTVTPTDNSLYTTIVFTGTIRADGSMGGIYTLSGTSQGGTWQFRPA